jgi:cell division protein FtsB
VTVNNVVLTLPYVAPRQAAAQPAQPAQPPQPATQGLTLSPPQTPAEYHGLVDRREELMGQLNQARSERSGMSHEIQRVSPSEAASLQARARTLDARIERLNAEIDRTNDLIINTSPDVLAAVRAEAREATMPPVGGERTIPREVIPLAGMFSVFFLFPIAIAMSRWIWKRSSAPVRQTALPDAASLQRMDQLQQSVDAIALEVERISEGQRYVAKLFAETPRDRIGS